MEHDIFVGSITKSQPSCAYSAYLYFALVARYNFSRLEIVARQANAVYKTLCVYPMLCPITSLR